METPLSRVFDALMTYADMKAANDIAGAHYRGQVFSTGDLDQAVMTATISFNEAVRVAVIDHMGGHA